MPLSREERKLLHQKSKQPTFGVNEPDSREGHDGDISFRKVENAGTVQYVKRNGDWLAMSSSGNMPMGRTIIPSSSASSSTSSGVGVHSDLSSLGSDDHPQYLLIDGSRAMVGDLSLGGGDGALTFTADNSSIKIPDNKATSLVIEEADTAYLTFVTTDSGEKITLGKKLEAGSVEIEGSAFDIDGGSIDGTTIGANSHTTIKGTTIDATTDFTVGTTIITDDQIQMSPTNGVFTLSSATNGASTISTIDSTASNGAALTLNPQGPLIVSSNSQEIKFHDGSNYVFEFDTADVKFKMADDADTGDFFEISTAQHGATTIKTVDDDATAANLTFDIDGNIDFKQSSGTTRYTFNLDSTPELDVTGDFTIDGSGVINVDGDTGVVLKEGGGEVIKIDTDKDIFFHQYTQTLFQQYGFHSKVEQYHQTSGRGDFNQNFSILSYNEQLSSSSQYEAYPS
tara:strand:- start:812 stop:2176 length:1365 start_codon:yes stop_codon:yes gene_type:complete